MGGFGGEVGFWREDDDDDEGWEGGNGGGGEGGEWDVGGELMDLFFLFLFSSGLELFLELDIMRGQKLMIAVWCRDSSLA